MHNNNIIVIILIIIIIVNSNNNWNSCLWGCSLGDQLCIEQGRTGICLKVRKTNNPWPTGNIQIVLDNFGGCSTRKCPLPHQNINTVSWAFLRRCSITIIITIRITIMIIMTIIILILPLLPVLLIIIISWLGSTRNHTKQTTYESLWYESTPEDSTFCPVEKTLAETAHANDIIWRSSERVSIPSLEKQMTRWCEWSCGRWLNWAVTASYKFAKLHFAVTSAGQVRPKLGSSHQKI